MGVICVECGVVSNETSCYKEFSPGNIRMRSCSHCSSRVLDPYVEYYLILLLLDLMLMKKQVYRHCLYNITVATATRTLYKLIPAFLCLDVYIHWLRLIRYYTVQQTQLMALRTVAVERGEGDTFIWPYDRHTSIIIILALLTSVFYASILLLARFTVRSHHVAASAESNEQSNAASPARKRNQQVDVAPSVGSNSLSSTLHSSSLPSRSPSPLLVALLLSSFAKFCYLLALIWNSEYTQIGMVTRGLKIYILWSHLVALQVHLSISTVHALCLVVFGVSVQLLASYMWYLWIDPTILPLALFL